MRHCLFAILVLPALFCVSVSAEEIIVHLQLIRPSSAAKLDPEELDKWRLEVGVRNYTSKEIDVPSKYDGQVLQIYARSPEHRHPLHLYSVERVDAKKQSQKVASGDYVTIASFELNDILVPYDPETKQAYLWDWQARPQGPPSPLHLHRDAGYVSSLAFWAELHAGEQVYRSIPDVVTVEAAEMAPAAEDE